MTRGPFLVGLFLSTLAHLCLLIPGAGRPQRSEEIVDVIETELAALEPPAIEVADLAKEELPTEGSEPAPPVPSPVGPSPSALPRSPADPQPMPLPREVPANAPPAPALERVAGPIESSREEPGDLAGDRDGQPAPELRIDWGTAPRALRILKAGQMKLVVLRDGTDSAEPIIGETVENLDGTWQRRSFASTALLFSNNLRIVDGVPAFERIGVAIGLRGPERLAVLVPRAVERLLQSAQLEAAFRRGLALTQVRSFGGRFTVTDGALGFEITRVLEGES